MNKPEILAILKLAKRNNALCRMFFRYDPKCFYYLPIKLNDTFFYGAKEDDFITDGFSIRKISDLDRVEIQDSKVVEFLKKEKTFNNIYPPSIRLDEWKTIFDDLKKDEKYIIVEKEYFEEEDANFIIGKILRVNKTSLKMQEFDIHGKCSETTIKYSDITSVTFQNRYANIWAKYFHIN